MKSWAYEPNHLHCLRSMASTAKQTGITDQIIQFHAVII